jgi:hypothetical protein
MLRFLAITDRYPCVGSKVLAAILHQRMLDVGAFAHPEQCGFRPTRRSGSAWGGAPVHTIYTYSCTLLGLMVAEYFKFSVHSYACVDNKNVGLFGRVF